MAAGFFVASVLLEKIVGKKVIFGGTGDMVHPVIWTWCVGRERDKRDKRDKRDMRETRERQERQEKRENRQEDHLRGDKGHGPHSDLDVVRRGVCMWARGKRG